MFPKSKSKSQITTLTIFTLLSTVCVFFPSNVYSMKICENTKPSIKIIDEFYKPFDPVPFYYSPNTSLFKEYVTTISDQVFAKTNEIALSQSDRATCPEVNLFFVLRPLTSSVIRPFIFKPSISEDTRYLDSPWVQLTISKSPRLIVQGVFVWNERQFLLDQLLMSDAQAVPVPTRDLLPINQPTFDKYIKDYREYARSRIPSDILLMFHSSFQIFSIPISPEIRFLRRTIKAASVPYTELSKSLVDQFLESTKTEIRYESVLDLQKVFNLDRYKINLNTLY